MQSDSPVRIVTPLVDEKQPAGSSSAQTEAIYKGYDPQRSEGSAVCPVFRTSTFIFKNAAQGKRAFEIAYGLSKPLAQESCALIYSRVNNPNCEILEERIVGWDKAEAALLFSSGMGAISSSCLAFLRPGDALLFSDPVYGGTEFFFRHILPQFGVETYSFCAGATFDEMDDVVVKHCAQKKLRMVYVETPSNPTIMLSDLAAARRMCDLYSSRDRAVLMAVDNTFLGPIFCSPLMFGADIILYSATKFFGGHSDLIAGVAMGRRDVVNSIKAYRSILGSVSDADTAWLIQRSLPTLDLRMHRQQDTAKKVVQYLLKNPKVTHVSYPGLETNDSRQLDLFRAQCKGTGSLITFTLPGGEAESFRFLDALRKVKLAVSLGGVESLIEHPHSMTHSDMTSDEKKHAGITDNMIRLSVGLEDPDDIIADITQALEKI